MLHDPLRDDGLREVRVGAAQLGPIGRDESPEMHQRIGSYEKKRSRQSREVSR